LLYGPGMDDEQRRTPLHAALRQQALAQDLLRSAEMARAMLGPSQELIQAARRTLQDHEAMLRSVGLDFKALSAQALDLQRTYLGPLEEARRALVATGAGDVKQWLETARAMRSLTDPERVRSGAYPGELARRIAHEEIISNRAAQDLLAQQRQILSGIQGALAGGLLNRAVRDALTASFGGSLVNDLGAVAMLQAMGGTVPAGLRAASPLVDAVATLAEVEAAVADKAADEGAVEPILTAVVATLVHHLARAKSWIERQSIIELLALLVAVLALANDYGGSGDQEATRRAIENGFAMAEARLSDIRDEIARQNAETASPKEPVRLAVARTAHVRELPTTKSRSRDKLAPGHLLELLDVRGDWFQVRYVDGLSGEVRSGWIFGKLTVPK